LPRRTELLVRQTGDADVHVVGRRARAVDIRRDRREAVRRDDRDARAEPGPQILDQLAAVLADQAAEEDRVRPGLLDLVGKRLVRRGLRIPGREAGRREADARQDVLEVACDALAVRLLVVEDVHLFRAELLREQGV